MNLLGSALADPAVAVSKATTALLAMTVIDTSALRITFTVPPSGKAKVIAFGGALHGAATYPVILLGILNGATVVARVAPTVTVCGAASATTPGSLYAEFIVTGLTPGASLTWDLAYGVEQLVAATGLKYGGPNNNTTAGDAFGGISFQIWDPQPITAGAQLAVDTSGRVDVGKVAGTAQTARDLGAQLDAAVSTRATPTNITAGTITTVTNLTNLPTIPANWLTAAGIAAGALNGKGDWLLSSGYTAPDNAGISTLTGRLTAGRATNLDNLDAAVSTRSTYAGADTAGTTTLLSRLTSGRATNLDNLDAAISTRLAAAGYTAPLDAASLRAAVGLASANLDTQLSGISSKTTNLPSDPADASDIAAAFGTVNATLSTIAGYIDTEVGAIKGVVDKLDTAMELDGAVYRFTLNALELAPTGGGGSGLDAAGVRAAVGLGSANLDTQLAAIKADTAGVKTKTDQLAFTVAGQVDGNMKSVAGTTINGSGTAGSPWGP